MKRNRSDIPAQTLLLGAGAVFAVIIISVGIYMLAQGKQLSNAAGSAIADAAGAIADADVMQYDGLSVNGQQVIDFYKKHLGEFGAGEQGPFEVVINNGTATTAYTNGDSLTHIRDNTDANRYVKPTSLYVCTVTKNANGVIIKVAFTIR